MSLPLKALAELLDETVEEVSDCTELSELEREELPAAVSHLLWNPDGQVPLLNSEVRHCVLALACSKLFRDDGARPSCSRHAECQTLGESVPELFAVPYAPHKRASFTFIDLFAGIGGFRIAFQDVGGRCVFSSEWDRFAKVTYMTNFGELPYGDIRRIPKHQIPDHDVLCAGFPCQPFSLAGVSKKNSLGRQHGFLDETQGTLFFEIKEILRTKRPRAFMLENVKNILSHDRGRTFEVIRRSLQDELGYSVVWSVVDGSNWVPQRRERVFIVGFDPATVPLTDLEVKIPTSPHQGYRRPALGEIIGEREVGYTIGEGTWQTLLRHKAYHAERGHGFGYGLHSLPIGKDEITRTLSARYHKDGAEILIEQPGDRPRRLTVREAMQLQGFDPENFVIPVSNTQAYRQLGNSVVVPAIRDCASMIARILCKPG
ncbi:MAG: DNA (cytosine-5-)-methyltransferase [Anaerolineae bacterium]|jgi:DNA (cytosine-5)-methyltransferase 1